MKTNKLNKWAGVEFESSSGKTPQFKSFVRDFRSEYKKIAARIGANIELSVGHFYISGFFERGGKYVYFSIPDVRFFPGEYYVNILIRTAKSNKDYTGGCNKQVIFDQLAPHVNALLNY